MHGRMCAACCVLRAAGRRAHPWGVVQRQEGRHRYVCMHACMCVCVCVSISPYACMHACVLTQPFPLGHRRLLQRGPLEPSTNDVGAQRSSLALDHDRMCDCCEAGGGGHLRRGWRGHGCVHGNARTAAAGTHSSGRLVQQRQARTAAAGSPATMMQAGSASSVSCVGWRDCILARDVLLLALMMSEDASCQVELKWASVVGA